MLSLFSVHVTANSVMGGYVDGPAFQARFDAVEGSLERISSNMEIAMPWPAFGDLDGDGDQAFSFPRTQVALD